MSTTRALVTLAAALAAASAAPLSATDTWTTQGNSLMLNGKPVTLHGLGLTCTEFLLRSYAAITCIPTMQVYSLVRCYTG